MKNFFLNKKPYLISILYIAISCILFSTIFFYIKNYIEFYFEDNISIQQIIVIFSLFLILLNIVVLPKLANFNKGRIIRRPYTPLEAILIFFSIYILREALGDGTRYFFIDVGLVTLMMTLGGVIVNYRVQSGAIRDSQIGNSISDEDIKSITLHTINSNGFISTLKTSLPKSNKNEPSTSHIPFILSTVQTKIDNFKNSAQVFFVALIFFMILFSILILTYGFILIDEGATRAERTAIKLAKLSTKIESFYMVKMEKIFDIQTNVEKIEKELIEVTKKPYSFLSTRYTRTVRSNENKLVELRIAHDFYTDCAKSFHTANLLYGEDVNMPINLREKILNQLKLCEEYSFNIEKNLNEINSILEAIKVLSKNINSNASNNESKIYELLKRIAIGLIVGTFFLMIIKYLAQQYSFHISGYDKASQEEIKIRKFYLGYELSKDDDLKKSELLRLWMTSTEYPLEAKRNEESFDHGLGDNDKKILSEILEIIKKKI